MTLDKAIIKRILSLCEEKDLTINALANLAGLYQSSVNNIISGLSHSPKIITLYRICQGFNITLAEFFNDEIFMNIDDD